MEPTPAGAQTAPDEKPRSLLRKLLVWGAAGLTTSTLVAGVVAWWAWNAASEQAMVPVADLLGGLAQATGNLPTTDVEQAVQELTANLPVLEEDAPDPIRPVVPPADAGLSGAVVLDSGARAAETPDAAVARVRVRPDPTQPVAWYDDKGQPHITMPEAVPAKYRAALGLE